MKVTVISSDSDDSLTRRINEECTRLEKESDIVDIQYVSPTKLPQFDTLLFSAMIKYIPKHSL